MESNPSSGVSTSAGAHRSIDANPRTPTISPLSTEAASTELSSTEDSRTEYARTEVTSTEVTSTERSSTEAPNAEASSAVTPRAEVQSAAASRSESEGEPRSPKPGIGYRHPATPPLNLATAPLPPVPHAYVGRTDWLRAVARDRDVALCCMATIGVVVGDLNDPFQCVLHPECLARLVRGRNGEIVYKDGSLGDKRRRFLTLPGLRASLGYGKPRRLGGLELSLWRLRLLHDATLLLLPCITMPPTPEGCPGFVSRVRDGFELLVRCREWLEPGAPVAFARAFASAWCDLPPEQVRDALDYLVVHGAIVKVGEAASSHLRPSYLYRPGPA